MGWGEDSEHGGDISEFGIADQARRWRLLNVVLRIMLATRSRRQRAAPRKQMYNDSILVCRVQNNLFLLFRIALALSTSCF